MRRVRRHPRLHTSAVHHPHNRKGGKEQPGLNAHFDDEAGYIRQFGGVHVGIATQTPNGLGSCPSCAMPKA